MPSPNHTSISPAQVAVLAERVDTMINAVSKMEGALTQIGAAVGQMAVFQEKLAAADGKFARLFELSDSSQLRIASLEGEVRSGNRIARLGLFGAPFVIAALVWGHAELLALRTQDSQQAARLTLLEFVNGASKPGAPLSMPPDTSSGK